MSPAVQRSHGATPSFEWEGISAKSKAEILWKAQEEVFCFSVPLSVVSISICGQTHFQQIPHWKKKKVPSPLKPYTANGFHLSHNNPDNMRNCTKFILSLCPCSLFFGFPSTKWKSYPNAFEKKKKKYIGRYSKLGERSQRFHKEKIKTNRATSRIQQTIWGPHTDQTHFIQDHSNFRLICLFWGAQVGWLCRTSQKQQKSVDVLLKHPSCIKTLM